MSLTQKCIQTFWDGPNENEINKTVQASKNTNINSWPDCTISENVFCWVLRSADYHLQPIISVSIGWQSNTQFFICLRDVFSSHSNHIDTERKTNKQINDTQKSRLISVNIRQLTTDNPNVIQSDVFIYFRWTSPQTLTLRSKQASICWVQDEITSPCSLTQIIFIIRTEQTVEGADLDRGTDINHLLNKD